MHWQMLWPEFLKKRLCRYLLQHYLGHFFKEKISLEQLSIDIYNGTGCVKNLNLDCDALNEQLNAASSSNPTNTSSSSSNSGSKTQSSVPFEIVSGFVGYISVYIPWHDLFNDYCKLTIKNVQITIRTKQRKQRHASSFSNTNNHRRSYKTSNDAEHLAAADNEDNAESNYYDDGGDNDYYDDVDNDDDADNTNDNDASSTNSNSMFSSMFVDSIMNTSMHIAQECLNEEKLSRKNFKNRTTNQTKKTNFNVDTDNNLSEHFLYDDDDDVGLNDGLNTKFNNKSTSAAAASSSSSNSTNTSLLGLEAFASTIDSILSRIKINLEQIQIRIEHIDSSSSSFKSFKLNDSNIMSSSTLFSNRPSNGIALELRIKSIKYFDLDTASVSSQSANSTTTTTGSSNSNQSKQDSANNSSSSSSQTSNNLNVRNTTKSFNIEGLTIYFDEFIVKDENETDLNTDNQNRQQQHQQVGVNLMTQSIYVRKDDETDSLNLNEPNSLNSTIDLGESSTSNSLEHTTTTSTATTVNTSRLPQDESPPFNFELNSDYYLYTNPIILITFSGIQSIKLTINNMRPTDMILEATAASSSLATTTNNIDSSSIIGGTKPSINSTNLDSTKQIQQQQRPLLELNAQFGSIKCLLCPKQIHLLLDMFTKLNEYIESINASKKAFKNQQRIRYLNKLNKAKLKSLNQPLRFTQTGAGINKPIRGCDKRKYESLIQTDLMYNSSTNIEHLDEENLLLARELEDDDNFKSIIFTNNNNAIGGMGDNETSVMFYSMMSESVAFSNNSNSNQLNSSDPGMEGGFGGAGGGGCASGSGIGSGVQFKENEFNYADSHQHDSAGIPQVDSDEEDKIQVTFTKELKQTIEQLQTDVIVANQAKSTNHLAASVAAKQNSNRHNLFQTFKITLRMFSLTVLHHDPPVSTTKTSTTTTTTTNPINNDAGFFYSSNNTKQLLVERMKTISNTYFDWVSTIDASNLSGSSTSSGSASAATSSIDKITLLKYHQACAFNDHFLIIMKPINLNLIQKINQRHLTNASTTSRLMNPSKQRAQSQIIQYSLNEIAISIGYVQLDEYLVAAESKPKSMSQKASKESSAHSTRRFKSTLAIEASQQATITELIHFTDSSSSNSPSNPMSQLEQACIKIQLIIYEPLELINTLTRTRIPLNSKSFSLNSTSSSHMNNNYIQTHLLNRHFENISIHLKQSLVCELDISIIDRLYYLINDISKFTGSNSSVSSNKLNVNSNQQSHQQRQQQMANSNELINKFQNIEIKCFQIIKLSLRFPIADLRRAQQPLNKNNSSNTADTKTQTSNSATTAAATSTTATTTTTTSPILKTSNIESSITNKQSNTTYIAQPVTMIAFRRLRDQIATFHIFDLSFQTMINKPYSTSFTSNNIHSTAGGGAAGAQQPASDLNLTITCSQINAYYQYSKKERPIHFGSIQQKLNEPRTLICSIRLPVSSVQDLENVDIDCQYLSEDIGLFSGSNATSGGGGSGGGVNSNSEFDSLKFNYNINVAKANRFYNNQTIKEENENFKNDDTEETSSNIYNRTDARNETEYGKSGGDENNNNNNDDEDEDDEDSCGPFSRIHSLISSEKNRRIVNAANRTEMQSFINHSKQNSQMTIKLVLPQLKCLIADQKFLNDIYNCFLNDLIMWLPSPVPPIESALTLYDTQSINANGLHMPPTLNYLIDYNLDSELIATRLNLAISSNNNDDQFDRDSDGRMFHMCRSAILKPPSSKSDSENSDYCESDDDNSKRKYKQQFDSLNNRNKQKQNLTKSKKLNKNSLAVIICIETAHLKAFILNNQTATATTATGSTTEQKQQPPPPPPPSQSSATTKYGEFDVKTNNFQLCIAISESLKSDSDESKRNKFTKKKKSKKNSTSNNDKSSSTSYKIEKQKIGIFSDQVNISHSSKPTATQPKYPTNYVSFENLFKTSKTKDLITLNDSSIAKSLFSNQSDLNSPSFNPNPSSSSLSSSSNTQQITAPMVSIGIKSKFNTKTNTKQLLVGLNFSNLSLHHLFCAQQDYWIFQLIQLFDLIDIEIVGYEVPTVITELHLNVSNSCIIYKPLYLPTHALIAFKSLHWSSNVTAESNSTLLVFNIDDIYLFLSKVAGVQSLPYVQSEEKLNEPINLRRDFICVANSDLFELRLLINDEEPLPLSSSSTSSIDTKINEIKRAIERKSPLLDIKIRSNLIQLRTCVDSAYALIEIINYIVSDGDLHQINVSNSNEATMSPGSISFGPTSAPSSQYNSLDVHQQQNLVADEVNSAISTSLTGNSNEDMPSSSSSASFKPTNSNLSKIASYSSVSSSIPIQRNQHHHQAASTATFTIGTPPPSSSFKSSPSSSASLSQQIFYSPHKSTNSSSPGHLSTAASSFQDTSQHQFINQQRTQPISVPLPTPSLSFNFKAATASAAAVATASSSSCNNMSLNASSSAESIISDMVKEAMTSNPMTQSIYGQFNPPFVQQSNTSQPQKLTYCKASMSEDSESSLSLIIGGRKRNTSLTLLSPDLQTKRMLSHKIMNDDIRNENQMIDSTSTLKTLRESNLNEKDDDNYEDEENVLGIRSNIKKVSNDDSDSDGDVKESNKNNKNKNKSDDDDDDDNDDDDDDDDEDDEKESKNRTKFQDCENDDDEDENLIASIHRSHCSRMMLRDEKKSGNCDSDNDRSDQETTLNEKQKANKSTANDEDFQFDLPFSDLSPLFTNNSDKPSKSNNKTNKTSNKYSTKNYSEMQLEPGKIQSSLSSSSKVTEAKRGSKTNSPSRRQLLFDKNNRRLMFKPNNENDEEENYNYRKFNEEENDEDDDELLRDFDIIDVIPGLGEPPRNGQEYEIKVLKNKPTHPTPKSNNSPSSFSDYVIIKEDHFKKPLTKIDVLKAPDSYPCPLNVYCIQEISLNWCMYGGSDFSSNGETNVSSNETSEPKVSPNQQQLVGRINRAVSSPIMVSPSTIGPHHKPTSVLAAAAAAASPSNQPSYLPARSRHNSTSSNSLSLSPQKFFSSPPKQHSGSVSVVSPSSIKFSNKTNTINFSNEKYLPRKAGGRITTKYDTNSLNWLARGGKSRNLDVCMEIALYKVKTKVDLYVDLNTMSNEDSIEANKENLKSKQQQLLQLEAQSPYLYRVALAIGDIEIRDKLASSPFNMFLFRYESEHCPKHTNSNMFFLKFLCSKSMDAQRLLECDIKVSIQPLRFNIDQDALIFLVEFFTKLASKDLNEFSKNLIAPQIQQPQPQAQSSNYQTCGANLENLDSFNYSNPYPSLPAVQPTPVPTQQSPRQVFIRNFIFSPDLLVRFDFSGKYDSRPDTKMDTLTKLLMVAIQLSNTEIKLKRVYYRRGFLGAEKLFQALVKEWLSDIQRNQMKNLIKGWGIFNSLIQFFEGFTYLIWYPIEQYKKDGRVLCGIQKGSAAFSTCTVLATIELTNRMFQATKNIAEFFYDLVTPHRGNSHHNLNMLGYGSSNSALVDTILTGVGNNRNIRIRRHPNDIREGLTNAYYVIYEGFNDTAANFIQEIHQGAEHKGIPGAIGGALRQLPSTALAPIVLTTEATCNILSGIRNQLKPDEKRDDDQKWKTIAFNS